MLDPRRTANLSHQNRRENPMPENAQNASAQEIEPVKSIAFNVMQPT
jgi:hypothetical protein